jgi:hypothetical protein
VAPSTHIVIYTALELAESTTPSALSIIDDFATVSSLAFLGKELDAEEIGGSVPWEAPAPLHTARMTAPAAVICRAGHPCLVFCTWDSEYGALLALAGLLDGASVRYWGGEH